MEKSFVFIVLRRPILNTGATDRCERFVAGIAAILLV